MSDEKRYTQAETRPRRTEEEVRMILRDARAFQGDSIAVHAAPNGTAVRPDVYMGRARHLVDRLAQTIEAQAAEVERLAEDWAHMRGLYQVMCDRLHETARTHNLGTPGADVSIVVCAEVERLRARVAEECASLRADAEAVRAVEEWVRAHNSRSVQLAGHSDEWMAYEGTTGQAIFTSDLPTLGRALLARRQEEGQTDNG